MALWNRIATNFDSLDETINFGTRAFAESDDCIYETSTLVTIDPDSEVAEFPDVTTFSKPGGQLCVAVNKCMTAFSGESPVNLLFTQVYDSKVSLLSCTPDGNFLFIGLQKGTLLCVHSATSEKIFSLDSSELFSKQGNFVSIIYHKSDTYVINSAGCICKISDIGCNALDTSKISSSSTDSKSGVVCEEVASECSITPVRSVSHKFFSDRLTMIAVGNGLAVWTKQYGWDELVLENEKLNLKEVRFLNNASIAFALSTSGELLKVCPLTMVVEVVEIAYCLVNFLLVGGSGHERLVAITQSGNDKEAALVMLTVPEFENKLRLKIGWPAQLISLGDEEDILYLECLKEDGSVTGLAIKAAVQTNPNIRLERLLTRGKFDAALQLAETFNLDRTCIYQTMAKNVVESLQPWKYSTGEMSSHQIHFLYQKLISLLDKIKDPEFICQCCLNVISSELDVSRNILRYAQKRISDYSLNNPEEENKIADWSNAICSSLLKLETMALIEPVWDPEKWLQFNKRHPLDEVEKRLKEGEISEAVIVWNRYKSQTHEVLKNELFLSKLLDAIPKWVSLDARIVWLKQLLPPVLTTQLNGVSKLVEWITPKIKALENMSGSQWPDIGLCYVKDLQSFFTNEHKKLNCHKMQSSAVRQLAVLSDGLTELCQLKKTYGVSISLNDYLEDDHDEVAFALLNKIDEKFLLDFLDNFFPNFVNQRHLDYDTVLTKFVERILCHSLGWWVCDQAPWEKRIVTLLPKITNFEMRLGCILSLLDEVPVPWSPSVTKLVDDVAVSNHPLAAKISEKRKQIAVNLLAKKYGIKSAIKNINNEQLVRLIIKRNLPTIAEDIEKLVNSTESQTFVNLCSECVLVFFEDRKYEEARIYLYKLDDETAVKLCEVLMIDCLDFTESNEELVAKIGFYAVIQHRLTEAQSRGISCADILETTRRLRNDMVLQVQFPSVEREKKAKSKQQRLVDYIDKLFLEVPGKSENLLARIKRIADLLLLSQAEALTTVAEYACKSNKMDLAIDATKEVLESSTLSPGNVFALNDLASALLNSCQDENKTTGGKSNDHRAVDAAYEVSRLAVLHESDCDLQKAIDQFGWARTWRCLSNGPADFTRSGEIFQIRRFSDLYCDSELAGLLNYSELSLFLRQCFAQVESGKEVDTSRFIISLENIIEQLQENQRDMTALAVMCQLYCFFRKHDSKTDVLLERLLLKVVTTLLSKVLSSRHLDSELAVSLLSYLGKNDALELISSRMKSSLLDLKKQSYLAKLGMTVSELWHDVVCVTEFQRHMIASTWASRLPEYNISSKELAYNQALLGNISSNVLTKLLSAPNMTVATIKNFCDDYNCDFQAALSLHLQYVLLSWDPDLDVRLEADGKRVAVIRNTEEQLLKRCHEIIQYAVDVGPIIKVLKSVWGKINLYYHEIFLVVLHLLQELDSPIQDHSERSLLLRFLKTYQRRRQPDSDEENSWSDHFASTPSLPPLAEFRLPFSRLTYAPNSSVITPEITLQSYSTWLVVAPALKFDEDRMRVIAVRQSVSEAFPNQPNASETWCTSVKYKTLHEAVRDCVSGITDIITASACLYFCINKTPPGVDQLIAAKLCLEYTVKLAECPEYADKLEKVQSKYSTLATTHVLHLCGLGEPQYLDLVGSPEKLCYELYQHPAIVDYCLGESAQCPNINEAVEKIDILHSIGIQSLQFDLIRGWLQSYHEPSGDSSLDEYTITTGSTVSGRSDKISTENLMRARYVMEHGDKESWVTYLNRFVVASHADVNPTVRLRALRCMLMLTDSETVERLTGLGMGTLRELQQCLEYVCELESLGFACSEKSFKNYNKEELAAVVLRTQEHSPRAIALVARLCLDYDVQQTVVWRTVLRHFTQLNMLGELSNILPSLTRLYHLWGTSEFIEAWDSLVITPFTQALCPPSQPQMIAMLDAIQQLANCPVLDRIRTRKAADESLKIKRFELAALLLPFCEKSSRSDIKKAILDSTTLTSLEEELLKICSSSPINLKQTMHYLRDDVSLQTKHETCFDL